MQRTRPMPLRHDPPTRAGLCLRTLFLCFFTAFFALGALACGGKKDVPPPPPTPSQEAGIQSITVSKGALSPAYTALVDNYSVLLPVATNEMDVTVVLKDTKARLTIAGEPTQSGVPRRVALDGLTTVNIVVIAEDALTSNRVRLNVGVTAANTKVWVLDSFGGTYPEGTKLALTDTSGKVLASDIDFPAEKNGTAVLGLDPKGRYNIYAKANGSAQACFANFDPSKESTATLYCRPNWAIAFPAEAPVITDVYFSGQANSNWEKLPEGVNTLTSTADKMQYVKVTARAKSSITEADWGPEPMNVMLDAPAWFGNVAASAAVENATPVIVNGQEYYQSTYRFAVPNMTNILAEKDHWLDIVVYDVANNRAETRVYLTVDDTVSSASDPNLAQTSPKSQRAEARTFGITENYPAIKPIDSYRATYYTYLRFAVKPDIYNRQTNRDWNPFMGIDPLTLIDMSDLDFPGIRGFEVWRSDGDDKHFRQIDTVRYAQPNKSVQMLDYDYIKYYPAMIWFGQTFQYVDFTPDVVEDMMYYKFRAFNGNPDGGQAPFSSVVAVKPLPTFTTKLIAPANGEVVDSIWPTLKFQVTNPAIAKNGVADNLVFCVYIKSTWETQSILKMNFLVDFADTYEDGSPRCYYTFDDAMGVLTKTLTTDGGTPTGKKWMWMESDGTIVMVTDSIGYRTCRSGYYDLVPGTTYEWTIFGREIGYPFQSENAMYAAYATKTYQAPDGATSVAYSFGSTALYGYSSPNGLFRMTIAPLAGGTPTNDAIDATE